MSEENKNNTLEPITGYNTNKAPWPRFWARTIDLILAAIITTAVIPWLLDEHLPGLAKYYRSISENNWLNSSFAIFLWIPLEAILLSRFTTTPGKLMCQIRVTDSHGQPLTFSTALQRTWLASFYGLALNVVLLDLICMAVSWQDIKRYGRPLWDRRLESVVWHKKMSILRIIIMVMLIKIIFYEAYLADEFYDIYTNKTTITSSPQKQDFSGE